MDFLLMNAAHIQAVAEIEAECFSMPWSVNSIANELSNPLSLWIVAWDGERVVGYVGSQSVMGEADMMNLGVTERYRRHGIGGALVRELVTQLYKSGVHSLTLEVRASNAPAISLYDQLGFMQVGRRPNYYSNPREDALILRKEWEV